MFNNAASFNPKRNLHVDGAAFAIRDHSQSSRYHSGSIAQHRTPILEIGKETKEGSAQKGHTRKCN
jgi:hypothetical protein